MAAERTDPEREKPGGSGAGERETPGWARRLVGYAWRYRRNVILALGSSLAGMAVMALVPLITKVVIDDVIGTGTRSIAVWTSLLIAAPSSSTP